MPRSVETGLQVVSRKLQGEEVAVASVQKTELQRNLPTKYNELTQANKCGTGLWRHKPGTNAVRQASGWEEVVGRCAQNSANRASRVEPQAASEACFWGDFAK